MTSVKNILLLASVFVTGASVLIVEIIALRILSPYYGNTIYTTSSVIGIILAALSLGYYFGGMLSDRYPDYRVFYLIITSSGLLIILMQILSTAVLLLLSAVFSIVSGPLISSLVLFFIPALCLGTLSPFAIKLNTKQFNEEQTKGQDKIGRQSGQVFFWSTLGSIAGSFLAGFLFIPNFGVNSIVLGTGIVLSLWGLLGFLFFNKLSKKGVFLVIWFILLELLLLNNNIVVSEFGLNKVIFEKDGLYQRIKIENGTWNGQPARFLFQDKNYSAAMYLNSQELVFEYTKYHRLYKLFNQDPTNAFVIGGGAYSIPKELLKDSKNMQIEVVEIEPELFELSKKYFNLKTSDRLNNYIEDGRRFLNKTQKQYDVIIADVYYSLFEVPIHFTTKEFFELAKSKLKDNGAFIGNFAGGLEEQYFPLTFSEIKTFKKVFDNSYFFAVDSPDVLSPQNIIFLGINGSKNIDFTSDLVLKNQDPIIKNLWQKNIDLNKLELSKYKEITDDFSPIEYLTSKIINRWYR